MPLRRIARRWHTSAHIGSVDDIMAFCDELTRNQGITSLCDPVTWLLLSFFIGVHAAT